MQGAKFTSYLFHPLIMPTLGVYLIFHLESAGLWMPGLKTQLYIYLTVAVFTCVLPLMTALLLLRSKQIFSLQMETREGRRLPYLISGIFYFAVSYFLMRLDISSLLKAMMHGATMLVVVVLIINFFWKISAHMTALGGLVGMLISIAFRLQLNLLAPITILILIAGLVGWSRLKLAAHSSAQVYLGFLIGVGVEVILFL